MPPNCTIPELPPGHTPSHTQSAITTTQKQTHDNETNDDETHTQRLATTLHVRFAKAIVPYYTLQECQRLHQSVSFIHSTTLLHGRSIPAMITIYTNDGTTPPHAVKPRRPVKQTNASLPPPRMICPLLPH